MQNTKYKMWKGEKSAENGEVENCEDCRRWENEQTSSTFFSYLLSLYEYTKIAHLRLRGRTQQGENKRARLFKALFKPQMIIY